MRPERPEANRCSRDAETDVGPPDRPLDRGEGSGRPRRARGTGRGGAAARGRPALGRSRRGDVFAERDRWTRRVQRDRGQSPAGSSPPRSRGRRSGSSSAASLRSWRTLRSGWRAGSNSRSSEGARRIRRPASIVEIHLSDVASSRERSGAMVDLTRTRCRGRSRVCAAGYVMSGTGEGRHDLGPDLERGRRVQGALLRSRGAASGTPPIPADSGIGPPLPVVCALRSRNIYQ